MTLQDEVDLGWVYHSDCLEALKTLPDNSFDAVVTDPPAGIGFMGKTWDKPGVLGVSGGVAMPATTSTRNPSCRQCGGRKRAGPATKACQCETPDWNDAEKRSEDRDLFVGFLQQVMSECLRVLKPGGHALVWALPRTSHWTATAIENAGFEVRDFITHLFGTGFPKSLNVQQAINKAEAGYPQGTTDPESPNHGKFKGGCCDESPDGRGFGAGAGSYMREQGEARGGDEGPWKGWGTALKPAAECWWLARKPLDGTVAANVQKWGVGGLNIDGCRIGLGEGTTREGELSAKSRYTDRGSTNFAALPGPRGGAANGRWPANLVLSHDPRCVCVGTKVWACVPGCPVRMLDDQVGDLGRSSGGRGAASGLVDNAAIYGKYSGTNKGQHAGGLGDSGGPSRFFYCAKANKRERDAGLDHEPTEGDFGKGNGLARVCEFCGAPQLKPELCKCPKKSWVMPKRKNNHPTVKPVALMRWLCRLVTPPGGVILDPFAGSGTTGVAAKLEGFQFLGFDAEAHYVDIANARIEHTELET